MTEDLQAFGVGRAVADGATFDVPVKVPDEAFRANGLVHGGAVAAYAAAGAHNALLAERGGPQPWRLRELKVHFLRPVATQALNVRSRVLVSGHETATLESEVRGDHDKPVAWARTTWEAASDILAPAPGPEEDLVHGGDEPWRRFLGIELVDATPESSTVRQRARPDLDPFGWISLCALVDSAAVSLNGFLGNVHVTVEFSLTVHGPLEHGPLAAYGGIVRLGRQVATLASRVVGDDGSLVATASGTFMVVGHRGTDADAPVGDALAS